jgi:hypothetical protein
VQAIATLPAAYQEQVIEAYAAALRLTFITTVGLAIVMLLVVLPLRLPRLGKRA